MTGTPRELHTQQVHYLRKGFTFADQGSVLTVGTLPAGALILKPTSGIHVVTAFNAGTNNLVNIGTSADDDLFGTVLSLTTATHVPLDEAIGGYRVAAAIDVTLTLALTGTAATTGDGECIICYIPDNDL